MARGTIRQRSKVRQDSWNVQVYLGTDRACEFSGTSCQNFRVIRPLWEPNRRPLPHFRREGSDGVSGGSPNGNTRNYPPLAGGKHPAPDRGGHRSLAGYGAQVPLPTQGQAVAAAQGEGLAQDGPAPDQEQLRRLARLSQGGPRQPGTPGQDLLEPWADQIYRWLTGDRLQMTCTMSCCWGGVSSVVSFAAAFHPEAELAEAQHSHDSDGGHPAW